MLTDRFGAFETIAYLCIKLARSAPEEDRAMDVLVAEAILEFGDDLRAAYTAVSGEGDSEFDASSLQDSY
jgi:hypothetical protein